MKKTILTIVIIILSVYVNTGIFANHQVRATKYYAGHGCGWVTADGSKINNAKVNSGEHRWVALSPDMFKKGYKLGDRIYVTSENKRLEGIWVVKDKMAPRVKNGIDFLMTRENSKAFVNPCKVIIKKI